MVNVPDYCIDEVADHTLGLILALTRGIVPLDRAVHAGTWDFRIARGLRRSSDLRLGLVGFGRIGAALAHRALAVDDLVLVLARELFLLRSPLVAQRAKVEVRAAEPPLRELGEHYRREVVSVAPGASTASASTTGGSASQVTRTRAQPSSASARDSATTATTGSPCQTALSTASGYWGADFIPA